MNRFLSPRVMKPLGAVLMAGAAIVVVGRTLGQPVATYDPNQLPAMHGTVAQYSLTPRGDVDGVILSDGTQVHLPPHLGAQLVAAVKPGDAVTFRGLRAQALPLVQALSLTDDASGRGVVDAGPPATPPQPLAMGSQWLQVQGRVREALYGPRGDMNGALLDDGTQVHLPPDQAAKLSAYLAPGRTLVAQGYAATGRYGRSIDAQAIGTAPDALVQVAGPAGGPRRGPPPPPPPAPRPAPQP
ncbi:hypothetical protein [Acidisphaera rubrifaciens]|uniref:Uncharacterized protein n=1 Tax=Acidisphaera rubrifaciens HS-AP3 TaxID=1231350 RepID=A0A0D6P7N7_9PROT|nr:hypothetical protein [Acidisphaera rubrifaciens]GAN77672.1 hypothetical protein Asru_0412_03 [Acidisphaera rubrifaciens HS-AP3]